MPKSLDVNQVAGVLPRSEFLVSVLFFLNIYIFIYLLFIFGCIGSSLLRAAFSSCGEQGPLLTAVRGPLAAVASPAARAWAPAARASVAVACGL